MKRKQPNINISHSTTSMGKTSEKTSEDKPAEKTSTWFALRNATFRRLWLAMVVSGSCIGAYNTAVYWALHSLGANTVLLSLMATVSALPYTLFTLPAGAFADMIFLRNGAYRWHLYEDLRHPNKFRMEVVVTSWKQHLLQSERMTKNEKDVLLNLCGLRTDPNPPEEWVSLSIEKEVLNRTVRGTGLPPGYIDQ